MSPCPDPNPQAFLYILSPLSSWQSGFGGYLASSKGRPSPLHIWATGSGYHTWNCVPFLITIFRIYTETAGKQYFSYLVVWFMHRGDPSTGNFSVCHQRLTKDYIHMPTHFWDKYSQYFWGKRGNKEKEYSNVQAKKSLNTIHTSNTEFLSSK